jgi:integrase
MDGRGRESLVFLTRSGAPLRLTNFRRRAFDRAVIDAGLDRLPPHDLRHTDASLAIAAGATVKGVQQMLGHQDASLKLNTYAGLFDDDLDDVAERLGAAAAHYVPTAPTRQPVTVAPIGA